MQDLAPAIEVSPVHHLPILKAYAAQLGLVSLLNHYVPTEMDVDAGTVVLALGLDTLSGRSPFYRLEDCFASHDTALLLGQVLPAAALNDAQVGRVLARLYACGTMKLCTACAIRAAARLGLHKRSGHCETTSCSVWGDDACAATQEGPFRVTDGSSQQKRPALQQFVLSRLCVERAVPIWGKPEDGNASDKTLKTTLLAEIAQSLGRQGVHPGASIDSADAALVTEDNRAARRDTLCIPRFPATYSACARVIAEAGARHQWEEGGVVAQPPATTHRPGTGSTGAESSVPCYGQSYRAVVGHSRSQEHRRQKALARERQASSTALAAPGREAAPQASCCRAEAEAAAAKRRAQQSA
jgi:Domain of unknown function (DUF4277)